MLEGFLVSGVFAFLVIFTRLGTALIILPGIGDSYVPSNIRLYMALGLSLVVMPVIRPYIPSPLPQFGEMILLLLSEFVTGLFIGTVARVLMTALDTAGMFISLASGISNAQVFNPAMAVQGSVFGAFLSITGVTFLFVSNLHHILINGLVQSYTMFPVGGIPDTGSMAELMAKVVSASFLTGFQIAAPFIVLSILLAVGMGVLSRLMPQVQVFMIAIPVQITLALLVLAMTISAILVFWLSRFQEGMVFFLSQG